MSSQKKFGGEYGEVRASIDIDNLNTYLAHNTPGIETPIKVKQFKVRTYLLQFYHKYLTEPKFGQVFKQAIPQVEMTDRALLVESDVPFVRCKVRHYPYTSA